MGLSPILPEIQPVTIDTMVNNNGPLLNIGLNLSDFSLVDIFNGDLWTLEINLKVFYITVVGECYYTGDICLLLLTTRKISDELFGTSTRGKGLK